MARQTRSVTVLNAIKAAIKAKATDKTWPADVPVPKEVIAGQSGRGALLPSVGIIESNNSEPNQSTGYAQRKQTIDIVVSNALDEVNPEQGYLNLLGAALVLEDILRGDVLDVSHIENYLGRTYSAWAAPKTLMESYTLKMEVSFDEPFV